MKKQIITLILISFTTILFSQNVTINAKTNWSGRMCNGGQGMCHIDSNSSESESNTKISFNKKSSELTFIMSKTKLDNTSKLKLTNNVLEKDFYLYTFDEDFLLPAEIKDALNIKKLSKIKQGNYLVKVINDQIIIKFKLE